MDEVSVLDLITIFKSDFFLFSEMMDRASGPEAGMLSGGRAFQAARLFAIENARAVTWSRAYTDRMWTSIADRLLILEGRMEGLAEENEAL